MKKGWGVLLSLAIVVGLGGYWIFTLIDKSENGINNTREERQTILLRQAQIQAVNTVTVSNASGAYTVVNLGNRLALQNRGDIPCQNDKLEEIVQRAAQPAALEHITHRTARDCGLDPPAVTVTVDYIDNPPLTLSIGDEQAQGVYILADDKLYLADRKEMAVFLQKEQDLVSLRLIPDKSAEEPIKKLVLSGEVRPQPIVLEMEQQKGADSPLRYKMTAPRQGEIAGEKVRSWAVSCFGLTADEAAQLQPSSQDMKAYGFDKPYSILDITIGEESYTLTAARPQEDICYLMLEGVPVVYRVKASRLPWLTLQAEPLLGSLFDPPAVEKVAALTLTTPQESWVFKVKEEETGFSVTLNEQPLSAVRFASLYRVLTNLPPTDAIPDTPPQGEPLLSMTVTYTEDSGLPADKIAVFPAPQEDLAYLQFNGKTEHLARRSLADDLTAACRQAAKQGDIP